MPVPPNIHEPIIAILVVIFLALVAVFGLGTLLGAKLQEREQRADFEIAAEFDLEEEAGDSAPPAVYDWRDIIPMIEHLFAEGLKRQVVEPYSTDEAIARHVADEARAQRRASFVTQEKSE